MQNSRNGTKANQAKGHQEKFGNDSHRATPVSAGSVNALKPIIQLYGCMYKIPQP